MKLNTHASTVLAILILYKYISIQLIIYETFYGNNNKKRNEKSKNLNELYRTKDKKKKKVFV